MKILTIPEAKQLFLNISEQIFPIQQRDFLLVHSEKVGKVAKMIAKKCDIESDIFEIAGWIHDIWYAKNFENHADFAIPILRELDYEIDNILEDCILNHGNGKIPKTKQWKIFQLADKLSIFDIDIIEIMSEHWTFPLKNDDINFLKMMSKKSFELLENF